MTHTDHTDHIHIDNSRITMSSGTADRLAEILELCDQFLRSTPLVYAELIEFCLPRPSVNSGWLIDMVGLHAHHLRAKLDDLHHATGQDPR
jgi:hypothetical protein